MKDGLKQFGLKATGAPATSEMLAKINRYALKELTAEDVFIRKILLAHNAVDRDSERFPEDLLDDFKATLPGKALLMGHSRPNPGCGLFFDAETAEMTPEQFKALTGEDARLPEGKTMVKVLWGWAYLLKTPGNEELMTNMDGGVIRFASIGFMASDLNPVKGPFDNILFWEYVRPGEALEGSLVWLGAQQGATVQKQINEGGKKEMFKELLEKLKALFPGKAFTEGGLVDEIKALFAEKETKIGDLEKEVGELKPLAEIGKAYREKLVAAFVQGKAKLGEVSEKAEDQKGMKEMAQGWPLSFLEKELSHVEKRVAEKYPDQPSIKSDDPNKNRQAGKSGLVEDAEKRAAQSAGKK